MEIERLNRNVKGLKNERADKLKKELETYEKMIRKIKRKVSILSNFKSSAPKIASFKKVILAEFHEITKYKEDLIEKTEEEEVCESESLNESLMENKSIFTQTEITVKDQETYIGFVYFNEETQTDLVQIHNTTEKVLKICEENIDEELMRLKELGFIPEDADIESWGAGYYTGIERGQTLGNNEEIGIEENMENNDIDSDESIENELKTPGIIEIAKNTPESETIFISKDSGFEKKTDDRKKKPYSTKIMEFNFKKREKIVHQKALKSKRIRDIIMKKSSENIKKRARMSKKMMLKTINTIYNNLLSKYKQDDFTDDFLSLIYQDFETKYFMKKIVDRKMIEFLCNLLSYCEILKVQTFLKFLDFSDKINQKSLINKKESLQIYLAGLESITKSKLGIMSSFDDTSEFHLIPTVRAIEFIKDRLNEIFPISRIAKCIEFVNRISTHDKKRLNKSGVIELEIFLSFIISQFEEHISRVQYTGGYIIKAVTFENDLEFISKHEITYLSELLGTKKHWKEPDPSQEFIRVEDLFASNIREIFPENFLDELESYNFQDEYDKTQKSLENFEIPEKHRFVEAFQKNGMKLDVEVFQYARKILEMQAEVFSS